MEHIDTSCSALAKLEWYIVVNIVASQADVHPHIFSLVARVELYPYIWLVFLNRQEQILGWRCNHDSHGVAMVLKSHLWSRCLLLASSCKHSQCSKREIDFHCFCRFCVCETILQFDK